MNISYRKTTLDEASSMVDTYNQAFYDDYVRYGVCPGFGHSVEHMRESIEKNLKYTILDGERMVGAISVSKLENEEYHIGCLCVIPEYQGKGIGKEAIHFLEKELQDWKSFTLDTPADKIQNVKFYTEKCGFKIIDQAIDSGVTLYMFRKER